MGCTFFAGGPGTPPTGGMANPADFVMTNNTATTPESFILPSGTVVSFSGTVTITGATTDVVSYQETPGATAAGCPVAGKTMVETIAFAIPNAFTFVPNGSFGVATGLLDTTFSTTATGPFTGAIFQIENGTCTVFSPAQGVGANGGTSYEYPGGGNTSIPAGAYRLEIYR